MDCPAGATRHCAQGHRARFRETTGETLALTPAGLEIEARPGKNNADCSAATGFLVSPKLLMALANDIHRSGSMPGGHHVTVRSGYQYVVMKTPSGPAQRRPR